ncbi:hypothetical protein TVAG_243400 [Trichomonas vaginalis G3]|uniref:Uncharacterized protein n=1 Tax=Trichomonas vaginalis (strain ATCC PRA-98 / G3) TaxID=412133 RepID=A2FI23_TRIV3|nr:hypothetical protein TVAGG3_0076140 [Trichomonas vaginalis G3]EAX95451.1 hypothetical protein TVAG_243400 [Trichomonas vaginalis G3]KAI5542872.1 hypothetical protein TVAGG3_0076140 [Trichomonas vaginalis G3]|eukprot:XP_001308381.1 hypothetical protein [Trichomonas vaginalis G3]
MKKSSSAKSPRGSDDQLLLQVISKLQFDISELTSKTDPIFKDVNERQINLVEIDKNLDEILLHIHNIQNESSSKINIQNNVEKLQNELTKIQYLKSILITALNSSKSINHSKIENYLQAKATFSNNLEYLRQKTEIYQAISDEMKQFNKKELNYTTNEEFNAIKKNFTSINQIPIKKYLKYAQTFQLSNNQANNDFILQFNAQHDKQLDVINNISNKIEQLKVFISDINQIQKEFQDLLFTRDSMNEMIRSYMNDVPNIMQDLESRNKQLSDKFREKSINQSRFFSLIDSEARSLLSDANQVIEDFMKHNKSMSLMSENEFLNYSNSHKENLQKMNEEIDNLINQRAVVDENNQNNVLSSENLQKVIIGLDGMKNMEKFASHVSTRLKMLEEDQNNLSKKYKIIKEKYEDQLSTIKSFKHYNASKKNDPVYNNLFMLYNKVNSRTNELMNNPDNL